MGGFDKMKKTLVVYGTRWGTAAEIAEEIELKWVNGLKSRLISLKIINLL